MQQIYKILAAKQALRHVEVTGVSTVLEHLSYALTIELENALSLAEFSLITGEGTVIVMQSEVGYLLSLNGWTMELDNREDVLNKLYQLLGEAG
jgi:hypothetical protein